MPGKSTYKPGEAAALRGSHLRLVALAERDDPAPTAHVFPTSSDEGRTLGALTLTLKYPSRP